jgi:hypothetical protein
MISRHGISRDRYSRKIMTVAAGLLFAAVNIVSGQRVSEQKPPLRERMFFGGSLGLQFGTYTDIQITPIVGLWVRPRLAIAAGPNYRYYKDPYYSTSIYGLNSYIQFVPLKDLNNLVPVGIHMGFFLHLEDELMNLESEVWDPNWNPTDSNTRFTVNTVLAGFGISQQIGQRSAVNLMFLWALNNSVYGLYSNPEIRISFNF